MKKDTPNNLINFSAVEFIQQQMNSAIQKKVSDLHFEPYQRGFRIRARMDGLLHEITTLPLELSGPIICRLKIMADLDIAEKRLPQDGHFYYQLDHQIHRDCRINACPTHFGEKIVIRILSTEHELLSLNQIGLLPEQLRILKNLVKKPHGLILVTGPTGSGKTITLYSIIHCLNQITRNISTIEDPIEIQLPGINQVNVNFKIGLDFAKVLRALLRQDPDIILIGEIRDRETAEMAVQAAQTGHLVLASLHSNSAIEAFIRLRNLGIKTINLINAITLIIAQRLLRKLCPNCKIPCDFSPDGFTSSSCEKCWSGYKGREGVFELLSISIELKKLLLTTDNPSVIQKFIKNEGFLNLKNVASMKYKKGLTSLSEISRVII